MEPEAVVVFYKSVDIQKVQVSCMKYTVIEAMPESAINVEIEFDLDTSISSRADRHGVQNSKHIDEIQTRILNALRDHCTYNTVPSTTLTFPRLLGLLPQLRTVGRLGVDRLNTLKRRSENDPFSAAATRASLSHTLAVNSQSIRRHQRCSDSTHF